MNKLNRGKQYRQKWKSIANQNKRTDRQREKSLMIEVGPKANNEHMKPRREYRQKTENIENKGWRMDKQRIKCLLIDLGLIGGPKDNRMREFS